MPFNEKDKEFFIHIPRTGGTTVSQLLGIRDKKNLAGDYPIKEVSNRKLPKNFTYSEIESGYPYIKDSCHFFSIVRNPWERILSEYLWRKKNMNNVKIKHLDSFDKFVQFVSYKVERKYFPFCFLDCHFDTQFSYLCDIRGNLVVHDIGRFENFEEYTKKMLMKKGIILNQLPILEVDFSNNLVSKKSFTTNYRQYYSSQAEKTIRRIYEIDIDQFKYTF